MSNMTIGCALWTLGPTPDVASLARQMEVARGKSAVRLRSPGSSMTTTGLASSTPNMAASPTAAKPARIAESLGLGFSGFCAQLMARTHLADWKSAKGFAGALTKPKPPCARPPKWAVTSSPRILASLPEDTAAEAYQVMLGSVAEIAEYGGSVGVTFALETGQEPPAALGAFIDAIGSPWLKVNYDPCNLLRYGSEAGTIDGVHLLGDKIVHTHAKDWNPDTREATCGEGLVPWDGYLGALRDIGYSGVLAIEDETGNEDMVGSIRRSHAFLRSWLDA